MTWFPRLFRKAVPLAPPAVAIQSPPIVINPTDTQRKQRNFLRIARLLRAIQDKPSNVAALQAELNCRLKAVSEADVAKIPNARDPAAWEQAANA